YVPSDLRRANDPAGFILDRRDRQRDVDDLSIAPQPQSVEMGDASSRLQFGDDVVFLMGAGRGGNQRDVASDGLLGRVTEKSFGACVPALNDAIQGLADDRVIGAFDNRSQDPGGQQTVFALDLHVPPLTDVAKHEHTAEDLSIGASNGGS